MWSKVAAGLCLRTKHVHRFADATVSEFGRDSAAVVSDVLYGFQNNFVPPVFLPLCIGASTYSIFVKLVHIDELLKNQNEIRFVVNLPFLKFFS